MPVTNFDELYTYMCTNLKEIRNFMKNTREIPQIGRKSMDENT